MPVALTALNLPQDFASYLDAQMRSPAGSEDKVGWVALVICMPPGSLLQG